MYKCGYCGYGYNSSSVKCDKCGSENIEWVEVIEVNVDNSVRVGTNGWVYSKDEDVVSTMILRDKLSHARILLEVGEFIPEINPLWDVVVLNELVEKGYVLKTDSGGKTFYQLSCIGENLVNKLLKNI